MEEKAISMIIEQIGAGNILGFVFITYMFPVVAYLLVYLRMEKAINKLTYTVEVLHAIICTKGGMADVSKDIRRY